MKNIEKKLVEFYEEEYSYIEAITQVSNAKITMVEVIHVEHSNGVKETLCLNEDGKFEDYVLYKKKH